ncbi:type II toxin-antitoxin system PemK/MazF family toxin [Pseudanabaena sp. Chao 1811]|uniref:type II toxin-antitoxin system PemK/MazF family toxin n=1 Tax=Pseudanabaena sp. Chao 1811 TaxID=2963092 RepID=UPI0022F394A8|nr:type II toxin-antitoxin system PemK/MazF family toxin [Pseudanabaena sp. Chao 1811]
MTFNQFDVVIVPFPFTDTASTKRRPALVISDHVTFNAPTNRSVMAMITTAKHSSWVLDVNILDLPSAGLTYPSIIRMKLFTLDDVLVIKRIGALSQADRTATQEAIAQLFRLSLEA